jgi:hypothetical protein
MAESNDIKQRTAYHIARARLLIDALRDADRRDDRQIATTLHVVSNELLAAMAVLDGTAQPRCVRFCVPVISGDGFTNEGAN